MEAHAYSLSFQQARAERSEGCCLCTWRLIPTVSAFSRLGQNISSRSARSAVFFFLNNQIKTIFLKIPFWLWVLVFHSWLSRTFSSLITFGEVKWYCHYAHKRVCFVCCRVKWFKSWWILINRRLIFKMTSCWEQWERS